MEKAKKIGLYALCILFGVYTADMIYRLIRYISAAKGDVFSKVIMVVGTAFVDGGTFMILSAACAALIFALSVWLRVLKKRTLAAFAVNIISCTAFMITSGLTQASLSTVMYLAAITAPLYLLSGLWCIYFCIKDLCVYFMNLTKENNK